VSAGARLFIDLTCSTCHQQETQGRGPMLQNLFGKPVELADGRRVVADEAYLRESIVNPQAKVVAGFQPLMPTFQGLVTEEQLLQLIAYVRSLSKQEPAAGATATPEKPQASERPEIKK
jgi:cytochrome c oxidase subunit 2